MGIELKSFCVEDVYNYINRGEEELERENPLVTLVKRDIMNVEIAGAVEEGKAGLSALLYTLTRFGFLNPPLDSIGMLTRGRYMEINLKKDDVDALGSNFEIKDIPLPEVQTSLKIGVYVDQKQEKICLFFGKGEEDESYVKWYDLECGKCEKEERATHKIGKIVSNLLIYLFTPAY